LKHAILADKLDDFSIANENLRASSLVDPDFKIANTIAELKENGLIDSYHIQQI